MFSVIDNLHYYKFTYRIPGIFAACIFHGWAWNQDFRSWNFTDKSYPNVFVFFTPCYIWRIYTTTSSEIDKVLYQIVHHSQKTSLWQFLEILMWASQSWWAWWHHHALLKNNMQMHVMTHNTWPIVVSYFLKPTV